MKFAELWWDTVSSSPMNQSNVWHPADSVCTVYYFFSDVYPPLHDGHRPLDPPAWWSRLFEGRPAEIEPATPVDNDFVATAAPEVR